MTSNGLLAMSPPWSQLTAYDLNQGVIKWKIPLGTTPGLAAQGITNTGSSKFTRNGPVVTAGGLLFVASGPDRMVHAYDKDTGKVLWETDSMPTRMAFPPFMKWEGANMSLSSPPPEQAVNRSCSSPGNPALRVITCLPFPRKV